VLHDFFDHLKLDTLILLGNSIGGVVASHYAVLQKEKRIDALILLASTNFGAVKKDIKKIRRMSNLLLKHEDYRLYNMMLRGENILTLFREEKSSRKKMAKKKIDWYRQVLNSLYDYKGVPGKRDNDYPVIAIHGEKDRLLPVKSLYHFDKAFKDVTYHIIPKGGHAIYNSHPEEIVRQIEQFLNGKNKKGRI
jgi:pimeloyl-ACP methyl ester carboxylesterase